MLDVAACGASLRAGRKAFVDVLGCDADATFSPSHGREPLEQLADKVAALGLDGVELPIRPGYQVQPENVATKLPDAVRVDEKPWASDLQRRGAP